MNFITHSLLPVTIKQALDLKSSEEKKFSIQLMEWIAIAGFGTLPDLLDFHTTVFERWTSWSHAWPTTTAIFAGGWICLLFFRKHRLGRLAAWCGTAYALHIPCDIVSGGIDFFSSGRVIGGWWISFFFWPFIDIGLIALFLLFYYKIRTR